MTENFPTLEVSSKIGVLKQKLTVKAFMQLYKMSAEKIKCWTIFKYINYKKATKQQMENLSLFFELSIVSYGLSLIIV